MRIELSAEDKAIANWYLQSKMAKSNPIFLRLRNDLAFTQVAHAPCNR
jgi:hypothetical protein